MKKLFTSMFLVLALLAMTVGTAFAQDATSITGTIQTVVLQVNATTGETIVVVTVLDETTGTTQIVNISLETAVTLGLVITDPTTGKSTVTEDAIGTMVEIDPTTVVAPEENTTEEVQHPVGSTLSDFFSDLVGVDYETIMTYHDKGIGFGVIAQALWLSNDLDGGTDTFKALLDAKKSGDYSTITLADGSTPDNWGAVVRSLKKGDNLGSVMSGHGQNNEGSTTELTTETPGNGRGNGNNGNGNGNSNGHNNGNGNGNGGNNNSNGNGNGH